ncbi:MAG: CHAP domain-containing protein [Alphaproteobacteria bacterium]
MSDSNVSGLEDTQTIRDAQSHLIALGYDLGRSGADGIWGQRSTQAAIDWQRVNGLSDENGFLNGDLNHEQLSLLAQQAADPAAFQRIRLAGFYNNFDETALDHLDPVRRALIKQAASHIGVTESDFTLASNGEWYGNNAGPDIRVYLGSYHLDEGHPWCASFGSWVFDQIEGFAGLERNEFMRGSASVETVFNRIRADAPQAIRDLQDYMPQAGDIVLMRYGNGHGHFMMVATAQTEGALTELTTIEGNAYDSVMSDIRYIYTDPDTGRSHPVLETDDGEMEIRYDFDIAVIDISELPNYDRLSHAFNMSSGFIPTPSIDPEFQPNLDNLNWLQDRLFQHQQGLPGSNPDQRVYAGVESQDSPTQDVATEERQQTPTVMPQF